ncbi:EAL domain-containing protein [uncultured Roseibium sp.]|uniref:putative bifunctional diguanylate cyclase/phosphodiesterase n=1 Tax=uncultured Roseibium sp. TaxID=1936171 RepID=UPI00321725C3
MRRAFPDCGRYEHADTVISDFIARIQPADGQVAVPEITFDRMMLEEGWLRRTFDQVSDYLFIKDRQSRFVMANRTVAADMGIASPDDLLGKSDFDLHPKALAERFHADEQDIMRTGKPKIDYEEFVYLQDGRRRWLASSKFPLRAASGEIVGVFGICRDISVRRQAEDLVKGQSRILEMIAASAGLPDILDNLVSLMESQLFEVWGSILLLDDDGVHLRHGAAPSLPRAYCEAIDGAEIGPAVGSCGTAAFFGKTVIVEDIATDPLWAVYKEVALPFGLRSCWSTPIFSREGKVLGTFAMYTGHVASPGERERSFIRDTTRIAAIAIERYRSEAQIRYIAHHDSLTGLPNRRDFTFQLNRLISSEGDRLALIFLDIDRFKTVNDCFGHAVGDMVLKTVSERIRDSLAPEDKVIRFGGDEFVIVLQGERAEQSILNALLCEISQVVARPIHFEEQAFHVTCSMGIARYPEDGVSSDDLLVRADNAMYQAKESGRDTFCYYEESMSTDGPSRMRLLEDMRCGIERNEFVLEYQPQLDLSSGRICGVEALVRWQHPDFGRMMPGQFIPLAEDAGSIKLLGRWVLNEACRQIKAWLDAGYEIAAVGVNVSARQFRDASWIADVLKALESSGLEPHHLELEITESYLIQDKFYAVQVMEQLRELGVGLAIDDFGTGYSSLSAISEFPLNRLKIDQTFIEKTSFDDKARGIAGAIVSLGQVLDLDVVAEGIETAEQLDFLKAIGCAKGQGYFLGRPVPAAELEAKLSVKA